MPWGTGGKTQAADWSKPWRESLTLPPGPRPSLFRGEGCTFTETVSQEVLRVKQKEQP